MMESTAYRYVSRPRPRPWTWLSRTWPRERTWCHNDITGIACTSFAMLCGAFSMVQKYVFYILITIRSTDIYCVDL